jgi:hypothetical protein
MIPSAVRALTKRGHDIWVGHDPGAGIGFSDDAYVAAGARIGGTAEAVFDAVQMIAKIKEPQPAIPTHGERRRLSRAAGGGEDEQVKRGYCLVALAVVFFGPSCLRMGSGASANTSLKFGCTSTALSNPLSPLAEHHRRHPLRPLLPVCCRSSAGIRGAAYVVFQRLDYLGVTGRCGLR